MVEVHFHEVQEVPDERLKFAVILAKKDGKWIFCKHKARTTLECPGGHRESGETVLETARRELYEETGALEFTLDPVCVYSVKGNTKVNEELGEETFGMLFAADVTKLEEQLHSEMEKIVFLPSLPEAKQWTYPLIQPRLIEEAQKRGKR